LASHLDENVVVDFLDGFLDGEGRARVEAHIDECPDCRRLLARAGAASVTTPTLTPGEAAPAPRVGDVLAGRYRLRRAVGKGAMGVVYEADDQLVGVRVAVKVLVRAGVLHRLQREVVLGRRVTHPNVCRLYDLFRDGPVRFLAMEFLEGETLEERLARGPVDAAAARAILEQITAAVEAAHREGIVHLDLKPQNVMIDAAGRAVVMDFGLARDVEAGDSAHGAVGTPSYWAPEQARGEPVTAAADVYSLGLIAYRLLAGRPYLLGDPDALKHLPRGWRRLVKRALAPTPAKRFRHAGELAAALAVVK
jgi:serine/threonine-protein kinase